MSQTTVNEYRARDIQGQVHNLSEATTDVRVVDSATNIVPGYAVIKGTADNEVSLPAAAFTQDNFQGIAVWSGQAREKALLTGINTYEDDSDIPILIDGVIAVTLGGTVVKGGIAFFVHTAGGASTQYTWRADADTDKASETPAEFLEGGSSGDIVRVRLRMGAGLGSRLT